MREYVEADKYKKLGKNSYETLEWSYDDCLYEFGLKGSGRAWKKYFGRAEERVEKRVFGWWLSYPWATMQSCVDNVVRIPASLLGTAGGTGWGVVVVPSYYAVDSGVKAAWNGGVRGALVPVSGWAWNTVASPPLSLVGQMPSEQRVDDFWVRVVEEGLEPGREPDRQAKADVAEWGFMLCDELSSYEMQRNRIVNERRKKLAALEREKRLVRMQMDAREKEVGKEEQARIKELLTHAEYSELAQKVYGDNWTKNSVRYYQKDINGLLKKKGLSESEREAVIRILEQHPPRSGDLPKFEKTDPVKQSIHVIKEIE